MRLKIADLLSVGAVLCLAAFAASLYPSLPDPMPTHWNVRGEADGYSPKAWGVALLLAIPFLVFLTMKVLPLISPRGFRMDSFQRVTAILTVTLTVGLSGIVAAALLAASGKPVPVMTSVLLFVGAIFIVLGNYLPKVRRNFFIGIRTPWTLASDEVWARTHRVGGWSFAIAGLLLMALAADPRRAVGGLVLVIVVAAIVPTVYSFVVYRRLHGPGTPDGHPGQ